MSQYFEYKCELRNDVGGGSTLAVTASAWSGGDQPVLAVATENGAVAFFTEEVCECRCSRWPRRVCSRVLTGVIWRCIFVEFQFAILFF